jgi:hypothetical protein
MKVSDQFHAPTGTHLIGGWVDPRPRFKAVKKRKSLANTGNQTPDIQPAVRHYTHWAIPVTVDYFRRGEDGWRVCVCVCDNVTTFTVPKVKKNENYTSLRRERLLEGFVANSLNFKIHRTHKNGHVSWEVKWDSSLSNEIFTSSKCFIRICTETYILRYKFY